MYNVKNNSIVKQQPWNRGRLIGQRPPIKLHEVWSIRIRLQISKDKKELALFNTAIDSKLRNCDLIKLRVSDVSQMGRVSSRAMVVQQKTQIPVQFEITKSTRQYARIVKKWVASIGLDPSIYATHSMRRTKPSLIYKRTKNLRAVQLLLGHTKLESTIKYLGVEVEDALEIAEQTGV